MAERNFPIKFITDHSNIDVSPGEINRKIKRIQSKWLEKRGIRLAGRLLHVILKLIRF